MNQPSGITRSLAAIMRDARTVEALAEIARLAEVHWTKSKNAPTYRAVLNGYAIKINRPGINRGSWYAAVQNADGYSVWRGIDSAINGYTTLTEALAAVARTLAVLSAPVAEDSPAPVAEAAIEQTPEATGPDSPASVAYTCSGCDTTYNRTETSAQDMRVVLGTDKDYCNEDCWAAHNLPSECRVCYGVISNTAPTDSRCLCLATREDSPALFVLIPEGKPSDRVWSANWYDAEGRYTRVSVSGLETTEETRYYWHIKQSNQRAMSPVPFLSFAEAEAALRDALPGTLAGWRPDTLASRALQALTTDARIALDRSVNASPLSGADREYLSGLADQLDLARTRYAGHYGATQEHWFAGSVAEGLRAMVAASAPSTTVEQCIARALADLSRVDSGTARVLEEVVYQYAGAIGYGKDSHLLWPYVSIIRSHIPAPACVR